jgi:hypothetical protein
MAAKRKKRTSKSRSRTTKTKKKKTRKKTTRTVKRAAPKPAAQAGPPELEEALAEPLADVSGMYRVTEKIAHAQRGLDEDETKQFKDPSLVIEIQRHERTIQIKDEDIVHEEPEDD